MNRKPHDLGWRQMSPSRPLPSRDDELRAKEWLEWAAHLMVIGHKDAEMMQQSLALEFASVRSEYIEDMKGSDPWTRR